MVATSVIVAEGALGIISVHFDVDGHYISVGDFIDTAGGISGVVEAFNEELFGGALRYEIVVLPPRAGTFLSRLGVAVLGVGTAVWTGLGTDIGKAFVKGATGNEPAYYAEKAGVELRNLIDRMNAENEKVRVRDEVKRGELEFITDIITDSTKGFMRSEYGELRAFGISKDRFGDAYRARNDFYQACYRNPEIKSLGFDETDHFPISRRDFPRFIVDVPSKNDQDDDVKWAVEIVYIQVTSPNWDRHDSHRLWKAKIHDDKTVTFSVDDDYFWGLVEEKSIPTKIKDTLKVQWAFVKDGGKRKSVRVIKVLEINGRILSTQLSDEAIGVILGNYSKHVMREPDLFEY